MKKIILFNLLLAIMAGTCIAQKAPYNVVFDVTSSDTVVHHMVIRWITEVLEANPQANVEIVFYAKSLGMITKDKSVVADEVMKFAQLKNVAFRACQVAMKNNHLEMDQLLSGVGTVPDGIYEIISKQYEGWGYIKAAR